MDIFYREIAFGIGIGAGILLACAALKYVVIILYIILSEDKKKEAYDERKPK